MHPSVPLNFELANYSSQNDEYKGSFHGLSSCSLNVMTCGQEPRYVEYNTIPVFPVYSNQENH